MKKITTGFTSILAIASLIIASPVFAATVISPSSHGSWDFQTNSVDGIGQFVTGPSAPPLGSGSVELSTGTNGSTFSAIYTTGYDGQFITDLANVSASYATYVPTGASMASYPKLIVDVNINTTTTTLEDELTFDPRNGQLQTPTAGVWQTWDARSGNWNSSLCGINGTLEQYMANCVGRISNAVSVSVRTRADLTGGVRLEVGRSASSDTLITGYVDAVTLGLNGTSTTYDFENDTVVLTTPTNKDECKKGGWQNYNNPVFKNQGSCVSFVEANENAGK